METVLFHAVSLRIFKSIYRVFVCSYAIDRKSYWNEKSHRRMCKTDRILFAKLGNISYERERKTDRKREREEKRFPVPVNYYIYNLS